ncbi:MAG: hypothetical protein GX601_17990 [Anaerolineales bacterium]|nr:hypothetical protein [Anaerolineales bacterium]
MSREQVPFELKLCVPPGQTEGEICASLLSALRQKPQLPRQVLQAVHAEYICKLRDLYPRAIIPDSVSGGEIDEEMRTFCTVLGQIKSAHLPGDAVPRESYVVALVLMAKWIFRAAFSQTTRTRPTTVTRLEIPNDIDPEALSQTLQVWCRNGNGADSALHNCVIQGAQNGLLAAWCPSALQYTDDERIGQLPYHIADSVQEALLAVDLLLGGASPGLVLDIVSTRQIPKEAELLFGAEAKSEKQAAVDRIVETYEDMEDLRHYVSIPAFGDWIESVAGRKDLISGMDGHWLRAMRELLPILPPEMATAQLLQGDKEWLERGTKAARRAIQRNLSRQRRENSKYAYSLDQPADTPSQSVSALDAHEDPKAEYSDAIEDRLDGLLSGIALTTRQQDVARCISQGLTQVETAKTLGISPPRVHRILTAIGTKLRSGHSA